MTVLVTGGAGYIGGAIVAACVDAGLATLVLDDLSTGSERLAVDVPLYRGSIADGGLVDRILAEHPDLDLVVHCAALTVVEESAEKPLEYYRANVADTVAMLDHLRRGGVTRVIFSSSASIYRAVTGDALPESAVVAPSSPYARTKAITESILEDAARAGELRAVALRYFNPVGADPRLRTGPTRPDPSHVLGRIMSADRAGRPFVLTGADWPTRDGSGVRDFIHVWDVATAHVAAIERFDELTREDGFVAVNVGGGTGTTVLELVAAFEEAVGHPVEVVVGPRRPGDVAGGYAEITRARSALGWEPRLSVVDAIRDALAWEAQRHGAG